MILGIIIARSALSESQFPLKPYGQLNARKSRVARGTYNLKHEAWIRSLGINEPSGYNVIEPSIGLLPVTTSDNDDVISPSSSNTRPRYFDSYGTVVNKNIISRQALDATYGGKFDLPLIKSTSLKHFGGGSGGKPANYPADSINRYKSYQLPPSHPGTKVHAEDNFRSPTSQLGNSYHSLPASPSSIHHYGGPQVLDLHAALAQRQPFALPSANYLQLQQQQQQPSFTTFVQHSPSSADEYSGGNVKVKKFNFLANNAPNRGHGEKKFNADHAGKFKFDHFSPNTGPFGKLPAIETDKQVYNFYDTIFQSHPFQSCTMDQYSGLLYFQQVVASPLAHYDISKPSTTSSDYYSHPKFYTPVNGFYQAQVVPIQSSSSTPQIPQYKGAIVGQQHQPIRYTPRPNFGLESYEAFESQPQLHFNVNHHHSTANNDDFRAGSPTNPFARIRDDVEIIKKKKNKPAVPKPDEEEYDEGILCFLILLLFILFIAWFLHTTFKTLDSPVRNLDRFPTTFTDSLPRRIRIRRASLSTKPPPSHLASLTSSPTTIRSKSLQILQ